MKTWIKLKFKLLTLINVPPEDRYHCLLWLLVVISTGSNHDHVTYTCTAYRPTANSRIERYHNCLNQKPFFMMVSISPVKTVVEFLSTIFHDLVTFIRHEVQLKLTKVCNGLIAVSSIITSVGNYKSRVSLWNRLKCLDCIPKR